MVNNNGKVILEFTLNGHKHTYFRRYSIFGNVVTTTNKKSAKPIKRRQAPLVVKKLMHEHGPHSVTEVNLLETEEEGK